MPFAGAVPIGVASPEEWRTHYLGMECAFRRSRADQCDVGAISAWLRLGEQEANAWAADKLIPPRYVPELVSLYDKESVYAFASKVGVHPGIVVGRLQHDRLIPFGHMNDLKATFRFVDASGA